MNQAFSFFLFERILAIVFLAVICYTDIKEKRIPNKVVFPMFGATVIIMVFNLVFKLGDADYLLRVAMMICIFLFGSTGLIGIGDIKVLMVLSMLTASTTLMGVVVVACGALIFFVLLKDPKNTWQRINLGLINYRLGNVIKISRTTENTIPFVPFLLFAYVIISGGQVICYILNVLN